MLVTFHRNAQNRNRHQALPVASSLQLMLLHGIEVFQSANGVALSGWVPTMYIERAVFVKMRGRQNRHNLFKDQTDLTNHQIRNRTAIGFAFLEALSAHVPDACSRSLDGRRSCSRGSRGCGYDHCDRCGSSSDCGSEAPTVCPGSARLRPAPRHATEPALAPKPSAAPSARCGSRFFLLRGQRGMTMRSVALAMRMRSVICGQLRRVICGE